MKKVSLLLCALLFLSTAAFGQALTKADRERGVNYLQQTRDGVIAATKGLSEAQMKFKPAPDRWSVAQVMEHIAAAEDFLLETTREKVMTGPAGEPGRDVKKTDETVLMMVPDRTHKAQAPEALVKIRYIDLEVK